MASRIKSVVNNDTVKIILAQLNFIVGDIPGNCEKILQAARRAHNEFSADIIVFSELSITGYPPEDLLLRPDFLQDSLQAIRFLAREMPEIIMIVGYPEKIDKMVFNSAAVLANGKVIANCRKQCLPNYGVFDEKRYFIESNKPSIFTYKNHQFGVFICEDLWVQSPANLAKQAGAEILISLNASPYDDEKIALRHSLMQQRVKETGLPILYVNQIGGQDDLIFDGSSFAMDNQGKIIAQAGFAIEELLPVNIELTTPLKFREVMPAPKSLSREAQIYRALVLGVQDYVRKNNFKKVLLGFSGGIDSALTLVIAVDALGKENVLPVLLPSRFTSELSLKTAKELINILGISHRTISIEPSFNAFLTSLNIDPTNPPTDISIQNIQARCRMIILMALSNQANALLLNTSNKSEIAAGYGTIYADMAGAYGVLKDLWKTEIYLLARYRNMLNYVIPQEIIDRPPTAELAPNQLDADTIPPYDILDPILKRYIEKDQNAREIIAAGFDEKIVNRVIQLVKQNEFKRRQSPPGGRVTPRAFTRERRYPITTKY